jgi:hypothetical protein
MQLRFPAFLCFCLILIQGALPARGAADANLSSARRLVDQGVNTNAFFWERVTMSQDGKYQTAVVKSYGTNTGGNVYLSKDYGQHWKPSTNNFNLGWSGVAMSSSGKYQTVVAEFNSNDDREYIYVSKDFGESWLKITNAQGSWTSVAMSGDGKYQTAVANSYDSTTNFSKGIYVSSDYGRTWSPSTFSYNSWMSVNISTDGRIQSAVSFAINGTDDPDGRQGFLYQSFDYGKTWAVNTNLPVGKYTSSGMSGDGRIQLVGFSDCNLAPATPGPILISSDYGKTFTNASAPLDNWLNFSVSANGKHMLAAAYQQTDTNGAIVANTGGMYYSSDFGKTWYRTDAPWNTWTSVQLGANGNTATATAWGSGVFIKAK